MISLIAKSVLCSVNPVFAVKASKPRKKNKHRHLVQLQSVASVSRISQSTIRGIDYLKDNRLCKGLALTLRERQALGLQGLLAPGYQSQEQQLEICQLSIDRYKDNLNKYLYLAELQDTNEKLFYSLLNTNIEKFMPIVYTPTVGLACQKFGITYKKPRGLFISYLDKGHIRSVLRNWPEADVRAIVFTDGERILGLGDLGAYGMGIPVGKLSLYTALAGIKPHQCLPITLDLGTDNENLLSDPLYIGLRQKRVRGKEYDEFIDEFMHACKREYGPNTLMQFEDFAQLNAARFLERYRTKYCTFNDDIQGTASVSVAGLFTACRITKTKLSDHTVLFLGAGSASCGIADLVVLAMTQDGVDEALARQKIFMFDKDGLLSNKRSAAIPDSGKVFAKDLQPMDSFSEAVATIKPTVLIGASTVAGAFTPEILQQMAKNTERPVIFALSNPTSKAECSPQVAYDNTEGRCLYASGSPFPPVNYNGKTYITGQGNNSYIFPGLALGILATYSHVIPEEMFLNAAQTLADNISQEDLDLGRLYPPLSDVKKLSLDIAINTAKMAYKYDTATLFPKPQDMKAYILENHIYDLKYDSYLPASYERKLPEWELRKISEVYPTLVSLQNHNHRINYNRYHPSQGCLEVIAKSDYFG